MAETHDSNVPKGVLDLTLPALPPRSRLYSLEPIGLGTAHVESLTSYIIRLAQAHCVTVGSLYRYELDPLVQNLRAGGEQVEGSQKGAALFYDMRLTNGFGNWAKVWVRAIESSTLRRDLSLLTTLPWGPAFAQPWALRKTPAWCPDCYDAWLEAGNVVYAPLIWMLKAVEVCTTHGRPLEEVCPHCLCQPHILGFRLLPGCCSRCRKWLGAHEEASRTAATSVGTEDLRRQTWMSTTVCEWVATAQRLQSPPTKERLNQTLAKLIKRITGGNGKTFARMMGVRPETVYAWLHHRNVPRLDLLLKICSTLDLSLTELLTGQGVSHSGPSASHAQRHLRQNASIAPPYKKADVITFLKAALRENPPPSLTDLAARLGYKSACSLRYASTELSRNITARHRAVSTRKGREGYFIRDSQTVRSALEAALERECPPSLHELGMALKYKCLKTLWKRFPDLCRRIRVKRADFRRRFIRDRQKVLEGALEEIPPPSLREVARRFGANNANVVYRWFPDLCPSIVARHGAWKKTCFEQVRLKLQAALEEEPPRPMKEVAREFDLKEGTLRHRYKELCRKISVRYTAYSLRAAGERRRLVREEVREVAVKLIEQGLHPSDERVRPLLKKSPCPSFVEMAVTLRSIRREFGLPDRGYSFQARRS